MKNWIIQDLDQTIVKEIPNIAEEAELSEEFTHIILKRIFKLYPHLSSDFKKYKNTILNHIDTLLNPSLQNLLKPSFLPNLQKAAKRIAKAVENKEKVLIWGDYDVDGITSTTLCIDFFKKHNFEALYYLPRREEGYGLNKPRLEEFISQGIQVLITVDCGVSENELIDFANSKNIDCIITDHHLLPENLPSAYAIVNPCLCEENTEFELKDIALCGVGVAFFLMCEVNALLSEKSGFKYDMRELLDLVALGTIADMVPLRGLNRILVKNGLKKIAESKRIGIQALKEVSDYKNAKLSAGQVSFGLAPRINAAGRMDSPDIAIKLLLEEEYTKALKLARELDNWNSARKSEEEIMVQGAKEQAQNYLEDFGLVLVDTSWNHGIVGIVASRMLEKYYMPSIIFTEESSNPNLLKGSGRSTAEIDLYDALCHCKDDILYFGGHKKAAGLTIEKEKLENFRKNFNTYIQDTLKNTRPLQSIQVDNSLSFEHSSKPLLLKEIALLEPFGINNPEPNFSTVNVCIKSLMYFGYGNKHLKLELIDLKSNQTMRAKLWNVVDFPYKVEDLLEIVYSLELDNSSGMTQVNMKLKDYRMYK